MVLFRSYCLIGAGHENRTRTSTLARSCTTTILVPHFLYDYTLFVDFFKPEVLVLAPSLSKCPREESNPYHKLRKLVSYPLNDEGEREESENAYVLNSAYAQSVPYWRATFKPLKADDALEGVNKRLFILPFLKMLSQPLTDLRELVGVGADADMGIRPSPFLL